MIRRHWFASTSMATFAPEGLSEGPADTFEGDEGHADGGLTEDEAADALASLFEEDEAEGNSAGGEKPVTEAGKGTEEAGAESPDGKVSGEPEKGGQEEGTEAGSENAEGQKQAGSELSDGLTFNVNGHNVSLGELKALAGQAINLDAKGKEIQQGLEQVSQQRAEWAGKAGKLKEFVDGLFTNLAGTDMASVKANSSPQEWEQFRKYAENVVKLQSELSEGIQQITPEIEREKQEATYREAKACADALTDPATGIPGYSQDRHTANEAFAQKMGMDKDALASLFDPAAWKLIDYAHRYAEMQDKVSKIAPKPSVPATKQPALKNEGQEGKGGHVQQSDAFARLAQTGSEDDALMALQALGL